MMLSVSSACSELTLCCVWEEHNGKRNDEMLLQLLKVAQAAHHRLNSAALK